MGPEPNLHSVGQALPSVGQRHGKRPHSVRSDVSRVVQPLQELETGIEPLLSREDQQEVTLNGVQNNHGGLIMKTLYREYLQLGGAVPREDYANQLTDLTFSLIQLGLHFS